MGRLVGIRDEFQIGLGQDRIATSNSFLATFQPDKYYYDRNAPSAFPAATTAPTTTTTATSSLPNGRTVEQLPTVAQYRAWIDAGGRVVRDAPFRSPGGSSGVFDTARLRVYWRADTERAGVARVTRSESKAIAPIAPAPAPVALAPAPTAAPAPVPIAPAPKPLAVATAAAPVPAVTTPAPLPLPKTFPPPPGIVPPALPPGAAPLPADGVVSEAGIGIPDLPIWAWAAIAGGAVWMFTRK